MILDGDKAEHLDNAIELLESRVLEDLVTIQSGLIENPFFFQSISERLPKQIKKLSELYLLKCASEKDVINSLTYLEASLSLQEEPEYPNVIKIPTKSELILTESSLLYATRTIEATIDDEGMRKLKDIIKDYKEIVRDDFLEVYEKLKS